MQRKPPHPENGRAPRANRSYWESNPGYRNQNPGSYR